MITILAMITTTIPVIVTRNRTIITMTKNTRITIIMTIMITKYDVPIINFSTSVNFACFDLGS